MKPVVVIALLGLLLLPMAQAKLLAGNELDTLYVTRYQLAVDNSPVYGIFDLGARPSVRISTPDSRGGKLRLLLHGRYYAAPLAKPFSLIVAFEDVTGRVFQQPSPFAFAPEKETSNPQWFHGLDDIAGLYGNRLVEVPVPPGTSVINLLGDDGNASASPYQLMGYVSHLQWL